MAVRFSKYVAASRLLVCRDITRLLSVLWRITAGFGMCLTKRNGGDQSQLSCEWDEMWFTDSVPDDLAQAGISGRTTHRQMSNRASGFSPWLPGCIRWKVHLCTSATVWLSLGPLSRPTPPGWLIRLASWHEAADPQLKNDPFDEHHQSTDDQPVSTTGWTRVIVKNYQDVWLLNVIQHHALFSTPQQKNQLAWQRMGVMKWHSDDNSQRNRFSSCSWKWNECHTKWDHKDPWIGYLYRLLYTWFANCILWSAQAMRRQAVALTVICSRQIATDLPSRKEKQSFSISKLHNGQKRWI